MLYGLLLLLRVKENIPSLKRECPPQAGGGCFQIILQYGLVNNPGLLLFCFLFNREFGPQGGRE
jgi:hypothetical protein